MSLFFFLYLSHVLYFFFYLNEVFLICGLNFSGEEYPNSMVASQSPLLVWLMLSLVPPLKKLWSLKMLTQGNAKIYLLTVLYGTRIAIIHRKVTVSVCQRDLPVPEVLWLWRQVWVAMRARTTVKTPNWAHHHPFFVGLLCTHVVEDHPAMNHWQRLLNRIYLPGGLSLCLICSVLLLQLPVSLV